MNRFVVHSRANLWATLALGLGLLAGCASDESALDGSAGTPLEDQGVVVEEPVQGLPQAPPFGAPREKLSPGEHAPAEDD